MNKTDKIQEIKGELSLVAYGFFAALIGVVIKILDVYLEVFQQIFFRSLIAILFSGIIYYFVFGKFDFSKISKKDVWILFTRSFLHLSAITLWVLAITETTLANATLIAAIPATAIIGIFMFSETLTRQKTLYLLMSLIGAIIISIHQDFQIGKGEMYAFISTFFFSFASLIRRKISDHVGDKEISLLSIGITSLYALIYILIFENDFTKLATHYSHVTILYLVLGGLLFLLISFSGIYGFKRVSAVRASSIEYLEILFAVVLGVIFFSEYPTLKDVFGGSLIVLGAYLMLRDKETT